MPQTLTQLWGNPWVWAALAALVASGVFAWVSPRRRSFLRLLPGLVLILVPVFLIVTATATTIAEREAVDLRIRQASIAAIVVAAGWIVGFLLQEYRRADERDERIRDIHRAVFADIGSYLQVYAAYFDGTEAIEALDRRLEADPAYVPAIPSLRRSELFAGMASSIHVLPQATIDLIVLFYSQTANISVFVDDLNSGRFADLPPERKRQTYHDYFEMLEFSVRLGQAAQQVLIAYRKGGSAAAKRAAETLSKPGADGSDR